jgi:maleate isomerase
MSRNGTTWQPDGSGWRARIGVLTHDDSAISESELWTMAPAGVSLHTSRVFFADLATFADPPGPDNATELLARLPLQAIIYAWTVGSYLLGTTGERNSSVVLNNIQMAFLSSCRRPRQRPASGRWKPNESH